MGTWGKKIIDDDFVADVIGSFDDKLKSSQNVEEATKLVKNEFKGSFKDSDDGPLFWIGLAEAQWRYGFTETGVIQKVKDDYSNERGLDRWKEAGAKELEKRKQILEVFITKIETSNPKPKKLPKIVVRKPIFEAGDCLSISLENGKFTAAIVLVSDHRMTEYGKNLIVGLNYLSDQPPEMEVFDKRNWLFLNHHNFNKELFIGWYLPVGFKAVKEHIKVIGKTTIRKTDPKESKKYTPWSWLEDQILLQKEHGKNPL